jgi:hypothetical protein
MEGPVKLSQPELLKLIANGNADAERFLVVFIAHCHALDDRIDGDKPLTDEALIRDEVMWTLTLSNNPWFLQNRPVLLPIIIQGYNAWLDSNLLAKSASPGDVVASDVVKGFYHEVVWHAAFLCGGWDRMREITRQYREYDFEAR